ncbi:cytochrome c oxidase assembly protein [Acidisphaera sp. L21]|uniref:cytochrome c oxidase assembly protein n=1 Tax=Acidisphaera sp. L21 TaxID=1641851 RepID=UPI00131B0329|nr:cytochrome c oxidase assembly protein [Acidisphaera sp. L21]
MTRNGLFGAGLGVVVAGMVGLAFASVPLYRMFCAATGYNGTPQIGPQAPTAESTHSITIAMNADTSPQLPWAFAPEASHVTMKLGEEQLAFYDGKNLSDHTITGHALYNVTPDVVGRYFHKTECFCFTSQTLGAGEKVQFPVTFWVDPAILDDPDTKNIHTITLSYTFFPSLEEAAKVGALAKAGPHTGNTGIPRVLEPGATGG